jgi:hypothetical protein
MLGLLLWIPQGWAATIHSTSAGGDWNKAETWVGGQVPTKDDNVVINGVVNGTDTTMAGLTVSSGAVLQSPSNSTSNWYLTVNGNITNNGIIQDNQAGGQLYVKTFGDTTNNGVWQNKHTTLNGNLTNQGEWKSQKTLLAGEQTKSLTSITPIDGEIVFQNSFEIINNLVFTGNVSFNKQVIILGSNTLTLLGNVQLPVTIEGNGTLMLAGEDQTISSGNLTANNVILGGSGEKSIGDTVVNGALSINEGVSLQSPFNSSSIWYLTVNGNITNNGIIQDNQAGGQLYVKTFGDTTNNGVWQNKHTTLNGNLTNQGEWKSQKTLLAGEQTKSLTSITPIDGEIVFQNSFEIINNLVFTGNVSFNKQVIILGSNTLTLLGNVQLPVTIEGNGTLMLAGEDQTISSGNLTANNVILGGSGEKSIGDTVVNGALSINEGVSLQSPFNSSSIWYLTVNGNITNNGIIQDNQAGGQLYVKTFGDTTNNGVWQNKHTTLNGNLTNQGEWKSQKTLLAGEQTKSLTSITPIDGEIVFQNSFEIINNLVFTGNVSFNKQVIILGSNTLTLLGNVHLSVTIEGNGTLMLAGENQTISSGNLTANYVILGGSGEKSISDTVINGSLSVNKGISLQSSSNSTSNWYLTVNGNITNNGIIQDNPSGGKLYMKIAGNILNNGTWDNASTTLTFPSGEFRMTGTPTWEDPKRASSYNITDYLNTQHHWQVSVDDVLSEQKGINDPSLVALPVVAVPEPTEPEPEPTTPEPSTPDTPKICETSKPSNAPATFNGITAELYLPQVRINTQYGNVYSINLAFQSASPTHFTFKLTDFCQFENPLTIADGENTAILNDTKGIIYIPSIDVDGISFYANLYLVKTEGWIFKKELDNLVGEEAILDNNKEVTFKTPILEVISFGQGGPLVPLIDTLSLVNEIELSSGILMINAILDKFENPLDPEGIYWKLGQMFPKFNNELISEVAVQENLDLAIWKRMGQDDYKFTLQSYYNPNDPTGYYWRYVECPTLDKKYLSPGSLFNIDNASCRQKADMHLFITSVLPKLIHLANAYNHGIDAIVDAQKFVQNTIDGVKMAYSVTSDIQDLAKINNLNKIDYAQLQDTSTNILQRQLGLTANLIFNGEDDYIARGIVNTTSQIITALRSCIPGTSNIKGCTGLAIDLGGDVISTINNFAASIALKENTEKLNSITCTLDYLSKYYSFGGSRKMLAKSVGLSQDASNFVIKDVLAKTNVCNSSNMNYTLSLIERYQEQISTLNSLNSISQKPEP